MSLKKLKLISWNELSVERFISALKRRITNIPNSIVWKVKAGEGSINYNRLKALKNQHLGQRCYIIGNGPSLARMDLSPLKDEITFGLNRIYLLFDKLGFETTFYVAMNELVLQQNATEISTIKSQKFLNWRMRSLFSVDTGEIFLHETYQPLFSHDLTRSVWGGGTVTYVAMQIAFYLGFRKVVLIGVDHSFKTKGIPGKVVVAQSTDPDHFDPKYFADGARWMLPDFRTAEAAYQLAKETFEQHAGEIVDATVDGKLEVFRKVDYVSSLSNEN